MGESGSGKSRQLDVAPGPAAAERARHAAASSCTAARSSTRRRRPAQRSAATASRSIFQEPMTALNPVYTIGFQITEAHPRPPHHDPRAGEGARDRAARPRRDARSGEGVQLLPAPALGRSAPARDDRAVDLAATPTCSSPTSRRRRSTSRSRPRSSTCCGTCTSASTARSSSSRTTWASSPTSPTTSS